MFIESELPVIIFSFKFLYTVDHRFELSEETYKLCFQSRMASYSMAV